MRKPERKKRRRTKTVTRRDFALWRGGSCHLIAPTPGREDDRGAGVWEEHTAVKVVDWDGRYEVWSCWLVSQREKK